MKKYYYKDVCSLNLNVFTFSSRYSYVKLFFLISTGNAGWWRVHFGLLVHLGTMTCILAKAPMVLPTIILYHYCKIQHLKRHITFYYKNHFNLENPTKGSWRPQQSMDAHIGSPSKFKTSEVPRKSLSGGACRNWRLAPSLDACGIASPLNKPWLPSGMNLGETWHEYPGVWEDRSLQDCGLWPCIRTPGCRA
jgi:hypothetical protein